MKESLKDVMEKCHADYARTDRVTWALKWPGMVVLAVDQVPLTPTLTLTLTLTLTQALTLTRTLTLARTLTLTRSPTRTLPLGVDRWP